ncbi:MAG: hypothetical protein M3N52_08690 [Actinomycetota bacterium]|nr:hypothetical protein [Actinomycetota bacterium]
MRWSWKYSFSSTPGGRKLPVGVTVTWSSIAARTRSTVVAGAASTVANMKSPASGGLPGCRTSTLSPRLTSLPGSSRNSGSGTIQAAASSTITDVGTKTRRRTCIKA